MVIRNNKGQFIKGLTPYPEFLFKKGEQKRLHLKHSEETKRKLSIIQKGKKLTEEHKKHISEGHKGEKAYQWKGELVSYPNLHKWVRKLLGKATYCSNDITHTAKRFVWANISGEYLRDINDYRPLCNSCNLLDDRLSKAKLFDKSGRRIK